MVAAGVNEAAPDVTEHHPDQREARGWSSPPILDAWLLLAACLLAYVVGLRFDLFDLVDTAIHTHEDWQLDEILLVFFVAPFGLLVYALRRLHEARRHLAQTLRAEQRYEAVFDACPVAVVIFDPASGQLLEANEYACLRLALPRRSVLHQRITEALPGLPQQAIDAARQQSFLEIEIDHLHPIQGERNLLIRLRPLLLDHRELLFGAFMDITLRKRAEASRQHLAREVDHRGRNLLATILATIRLAPRKDAAHFARSIEERVMSISRAHDLLARAQWEGVELELLLRTELSGFLPPLLLPRTLLQGPSLRLPPTMTQPVSIVIHEMLTNCARHGALSTPGGRLNLCWAIEEGALSLVWQETGRPMGAAAPRPGFGMRLIDMTIKGQLRGTILRDWGPNGLLCCISIPLPPQALPLTDRPAQEMVTL